MSIDKAKLRESANRLPQSSRKFWMAVEGKEIPTTTEAVGLYEDVRGFVALCKRVVPALLDDHDRLEAENEQLRDLLRRWRNKPLMRHDAPLLEKTAMGLGELGGSTDTTTLQEPKP